MCSEALEVSQNQTASKVVETLVAHATNAQARSLLTALYKDDDWTTTVTDRLVSSDGGDSDVRGGGVDDSDGSGGGVDDSGAGGDDYDSGAGDSDGGKFQ